MTQGGPVTATMIYVYYIYEQAFQYFKLGQGLRRRRGLLRADRGLTLLQWLLFRRRLHYTT